jgi:hypothetical protein
MWGLVYQIYGAQTAKKSKHTLYIYLLVQQTGYKADLVFW